MARKKDKVKAEVETMKGVPGEGVQTGSDELSPVASEDYTVEPSVAGPEPNIQYVGKIRTVNKETGESVVRKREAHEIPVYRRNGMKEFHLPDGATQLKGFYHPDARFLLRAYRTEFKRPVKKGE